MSWWYICKVVTREGKPYFRFCFKTEGQAREILCAFLPAYLFYPGSVRRFYRGEEITARPVPIEPLGPKGFPAYHGMIPLLSYFGSSPNLPTRYAVEAYEFREDEKLLFMCEEKVRLVRQIADLLLYVTRVRDYMPGSGPPSDFFTDADRTALEEIRTRSPLVLSQP